MSYKKTIIGRFGTIAAYADRLRAPRQTIYAQTRKKNPHKPSKWQTRINLWFAYCDKHGVDGFECKNCKSIMEADGSGCSPKCCAECGGGYFEPIRIVPREINKGEMT